MARINWAVVCFLWFAFASAVAVAQASQSSVVLDPQPAADLNTIVTRMEQASLANRDHYRAYVLTREYLMYGGKEQQKPSSEVVVQISFVPPTTKEYKITQTQGSSRGEMVVRHIMEDETKAAASGQAPGAVSRDNYDFAYLGEEPLNGRRCYVLGLHPKHKEKKLIVGRAWVDSDTYLLRRIQGSLSKLPSWWLKSVEVTLDFSSEGGMWLQTGTRAVADVRFFGPHVLTAKAVAFQAADVTAQNMPPARARSRRATAAGDVIGTALPVRH